MSIFRRHKNPEVALPDNMNDAPIVDAPVDDRERLPAILPTDCLREQCKYYGGSACKAYEEWMDAGGPTEGRDTSQPPYKDEATYINYGTACMAGEEPALVAQRIEVFDPSQVDTMFLMLTSDRYGEMPVKINTPDRSTQVTIETIASSD